MTSPAPETIEREKEKRERLPYPPPFMGLATLAEHLSVSHDDIWLMVRKGALPVPITKMGEPIWRWEAVKTFIATTSKPGTIYFIECGEFIKIGFTYSLDQRIRAMQSSNPFDLKILHKMRGTIGREAEILAKFKDLRHRGEWFRKTPELLAFIEKLKRR